MPSDQETIAKLLSASQLEPYIRHIRFPLLRNIAEGMQLDFTHPITAIVGPNGTNKTAVLRALQGCPDYENLGMHWFATELDPISSETRYRFIHGYLSSHQGEVVEAIKTRIERDGNPDYFEPSRPILRDGMKRMPEIPDGEPTPPDRVKTRWKAIQKSVVYLDFRSELSAFDKYWFHVPYTSRVANLAAKKAVIRRRSAPLSEAIKSGADNASYARRNRILSPAVDLDHVQVSAVSQILQREYVEIRVVRHSFFGVDGHTVVLRTANLRYSEAFAGSGEFAVVMLVKTVTEAPDRSLILLDEPETSLHPGAQRSLVEFLARQVKLKRHQVVMATHAPEIIRDLPAGAIKVLQARASDGKVEIVSQASEASEAFFRLGVQTERQISVFVEDLLAAAIVRKAMRPLGPGVFASVAVEVLPGGAGSIRTLFIPTFAQSGRANCLVYLDGDQTPPVFDLSKVVDDEVEDVAKEQLGGTPRISLNGINGISRPAEKIEELRKVLQWVEGSVAYLPGVDPESLLAQLIGLAPHGSSAEAKRHWADATREKLGRMDWEEPPSASEILSEQERALANVPDDNPALVEIRERVRQLIADAGSSVAAS